VDASVGDCNANPPDIDFLSLVKEDFQTHGKNLLSPGFWSVAVHRFGNWRMSIKSKPLRAPMTALYRVAYRGVVAMWGIDLPYNVKVGRRFRLGHHGCMVLGAGEFGDDVSISHSITVGLIRRNQTKVPKIGNRVELGPGVCIVGGIKIGDGCYVGANTVVSRDLPPNSAVLGIPMRPVNLDEISQQRSGTTDTDKTGK
jgi:serine O-acetyltransferase